MLLALGVVLLVAIGALVAWFLTQRTNDSAGGVTTSSVTTSSVKTVLVTTTQGATGNLATTASSTTAPTASTTAAPPPPQNATMPDVQDQTEQAAVQALAKAGILASLVFVPGTDTLGTVTAQAKPSGTTVPYHAHVQLNLSRGPHDNPPQAVPNVVGKTLTDAVSTLQGAQLRLIYLRFPVTSQADAGKIVQQTPLGGNSAPQKAQVLVYLGAYRAG